MHPDQILRSLRQAWLFLRRRGRLVGFVFAIACAVGSFGVYYAPKRHRTEAVVQPQGQLPYPGPLNTMLEDVQDDLALEAMASHAQLELVPGSWEGFWGQTTIRQRFEVSVTSAPLAVDGRKQSSVEVRFSTLTPKRSQGEAAVRFLAQALLDADAQWRKAQRTDEPEPQASDEPDYRAQLQALRASAPEADGSELVRRLRDLRQRIAEAEIQQASLLAREQAAADGLQELDARVSEEATQAYLAYLDAEREKARQEAMREGSGDETRDPRLVRIDELEAQLERMLATRTRRHPEVRELVRRLEAERRAAADAGLTPTVDPRGVDFDPTPFQPGPTPPVWRQRAPSYAGWVGARDEVLDVRQLLAVAREELTALVTQREGLEAAQARAEDTQRELARLERLAEEQERSAAAERNERAVIPPLRLVPPVTSRAESLVWVGWKGVVLLSLLLALGVGVAVDLGDDSYRLPEEVVGELGVPVLAVIPRLKGG